MRRLQPLLVPDLPPSILLNPGGSGNSSEKATLSPPPPTLNYVPQYTNRQEDIPGSAFLPGLFDNQGRLMITERASTRKRGQTWVYDTGTPLACRLRPAWDAST